MFFDKKTVLKIWFNLELNLTIFRGTGATIFNLDIKDDDLIDMMPPCKFFINFFPLSISLPSIIIDISFSNVFSSLF